VADVEDFSFAVDLTADGFEFIGETSVDRSGSGNGGVSIGDCGGDEKRREGEECEEEEEGKWRKKSTDEDAANWRPFCSNKS